MFILNKFVFSAGCCILLLFTGCATQQAVDTQPSAVGAQPPSRGTNTPIEPKDQPANAMSLKRFFDTTICNNNNEVAPKDVLLYIAELMSHIKARSSIPCKQMLIQSFDSKRGVFIIFEEKSYKISLQQVNADGRYGETAAIDLEEQDAGNVNISVVMRIAYALAKNNPKSGIDAKDSEFEAFLSSFPISNTEPQSTVPDYLEIKNPKGYKTLANTMVYWSESPKEPKDIIVFVEADTGKYTRTKYSTR